MASGSLNRGDAQRHRANEAVLLGGREVDLVEQVDPHQPHVLARDAEFVERDAPEAPATDRLLETRLGSLTGHGRQLGPCRHRTGGSGGQGQRLPAGDWGVAHGPILLGTVGNGVATAALGED